MTVVRHRPSYRFHRSKTSDVPLILSTDALIPHWYDRELATAWGIHAWHALKPGGWQSPDEVYAKSSAGAGDEPVAFWVQTIKRAGLMDDHVWTGQETTVDPEWAPGYTRIC